MVYVYWCITITVGIFFGGFLTWLTIKLIEFEAHKQWLDDLKNGRWDKCVK